MPETRNCVRVRDWIVDAAAGSLAERRRDEFDAHISGCAACREEFQRVRMLLQAIDDGVRASVAAEPSPQLAANVRQMIAAQKQRAPIWSRRHAWLTAAGTCAALAVIVFAAIGLHRLNRPIARTSHRIVASATPRHSARAPSVHPKIESATNAHHPDPALLFARRSAQQGRHHSEPEVLVEPGQMKAVLQFVAEVQQGKIDGAKIADEIQASQRPIEIKPLYIAPLDADASGATASSGERDSTSRKSNSSN